MKRLILPGIPFLLSFALSLSTAGAHCYWQDSGFFLVAVKELGILYPPGFALYVLLCKAWTLALWFVDFTYAVHLFSATCAALAAGTLAVAVRDLLRTRGPVFKTVQEDGPLAEWGGASIACLAASGYTFWAAAILAKVYAFYYLILTLLIWRMIRADESGKPRDFTIVAALIGLSWQAHPSATLIGVALILFVGFHCKAVGWKGLLWRAGLAALCAIGPIRLLPLFKHYGGSVLQFGDPDTLSGFFEYVTGARFTTKGQNFGLEASRVASVPRYFWEEFLGVGAILLGAGAFRLWSVNRRLLIGLAAWVLPVLVITVLFKLEGQHDFWMVAAWIPLWLAAAVGLSMAAKFRQAVVAVALVGTVWSVIANRSDLDQRDYTLAETHGQVCLESVSPAGTLWLQSDDAQSTCVYLQRIRKVRPDVNVAGEGVRNPAGRSSSFQEQSFLVEDPMMAANTNVRDMVPQGPFFKLILEGDRPVPDLDRWHEPISAETVAASLRRARGQFLDRREDGFSVMPEPYEKRLLRLLLLARKNLADVRAKAGKHAEAATLYESILKLDPWMESEPAVLFPLAVAYVALQKYSEAERLFRKALALGIREQRQAEAFYFLAALCGDKPEGAEWKRKALSSGFLPDPLRAKLEGR